MNPCSRCPCKPTTPESHRDLLRSVYEVIVRSDGFPCHNRHPDAHVLHPDAVGTNGEFHTPDCAGYKLWGLDKEPIRDVRFGY